MMFRLLPAALGFSFLHCTLPAWGQTEGTAKDDVVMQAMVEELERGMTGLALEDLAKPYFIQMNARERTTYQLEASYGGLQRSAENRSRTIGTRVRVGSYELDNTNYRRPFGAFAALPLDDDLRALRHTIWLVLDQDYKQAVETLTHKLAYLKDKTAEDRPDDFTAAAATTAVQPRAKLDWNKGEWEEKVRTLSAAFKKHTTIQDASVVLFAGTAEEWIVNSEGTRLRTGDSGVQLEIRAETQAADGMALEDSKSYLGEQASQLPPMETMLADIEAMCAGLMARAEAAVLEQYSGPVLFEAEAAGAALKSLIGDRVCARPLPLGSAGDADQSYEKKIGLRVLPRTFAVHDDPGPKFFEKTILAGAYAFDDEAVAGQRVSLVEKGIVKNLLAGRAPTKKISGSNGHGRSGGFGDARASMGTLYVEAENGLSAEELRSELLQAAKDEGLEFGVRVVSQPDGGGGTLGPPVRAFKVFAADGREEPIRGAQFRPVQATSLKRILAAGKERKAFNSVSTVPASVVSPAILFEELELTKTEGEFEKLPILPSPLSR